MLFSYTHKVITIGICMVYLIQLGFVYACAEVLVLTLTGWVSIRVIC